MRERAAPWLRYGFMLLLGLTPSLLLGLLVWFTTQAEQGAAATLARYEAAPPCPTSGAAGPDCRATIAATVISTYTLPLEQSAESYAVIGAGGDQTWDVQPPGGAASWQPGQAVEAEAWQGQIVLVGGADGQMAQTTNHPAQARARAAGTTGVARLAGLLGLVWAICFGGVFVAVIRPSSRIERPARSRLGVDP